MIKLSIGNKVNLAVVAVMLLLGGFLSVYFIRHESRVLNTELNERVKVLLSSLAVSAEYPLLVRDTMNLSQLVNSAVSQKDVVFCAIKDRKENTLTQAGDRARPGRKFIWPVVTEGKAKTTDEEMALEERPLCADSTCNERIGAIELVVSLAGLEEKKAEIRKVVLWTLLGVAMVSTLGFFAFLRIVLTRPIARLLEGTAKISRGKLDHQVPVTSRDEIGVLSQAFNRMTRDLSRTLVSRDYFNNIIQSMRESVLVASPEGTITLANRATHELLGYDDGELTGRPLGGLVSDQVQQLVLQGITARDTTLGPEEATYRRKTGRHLPVIFTGAVLRNAEGVVTDLVCVATDIRHQKETEARLQESTRVVQQGRDHLREFLFAASHHLREPLRKAQTMASRLAPRPHADGMDDVTLIQKATSHMQELVDSLYRYLHTVASPRPFALVDLRTVFTGVVGSRRAQLDLLGAEVRLPDHWPTIDGDAEQLRELGEQLLDNALKFHRPAIAPCVTISADIIQIRVRPGDTVPRPCCHIEIADNGLGFEEKYLDRIFAVFQRLHFGSEFAGTGMGLAICRQIVERHNGTITARSRPGEKTTFSITIPVRQDDQSWTQRT
jgi:PAS domain S-box-containing protein